MLDMGRYLHRPRGAPRPCSDKRTGAPKPAVVAATEQPRADGLIPDLRTSDGGGRSPGSRVAGPKPTPSRFPSGAAPERFGGRTGRGPRRLQLRAQPRIGGRALAPRSLFILRSSFRSAGGLAAG